MSARLFHITTEAEFLEARQRGEYRPARFVDEGFTHCSYAHQIAATATRMFRGRNGLVLLEIDSTQLSCRVVDENLEGGAELYPHVYGPIPFAAIAIVHRLFPETDGSFALPSALSSA